MLWGEFFELDASPDILVVHLGGNDLAQRTCKSLILQVIDDLQTIKAKFPAAELLWSNMILSIMARRAD